MTHTQFEEGVVFIWSRSEFTWSKKGSLLFTIYMNTPRSRDDADLLFLSILASYRGDLE